jgi:hypothetical protein
MAREPQMIYAVKDSTARVHVPRRHLPIVVVPDMFGTRLVDEAVGQTGMGKLVWNPFGKPIGKSPAALTVDYLRLSQPGELAPAEKHSYKTKSERDAVAHIRHFNHLVTDTYGDLVKRLADLGQSEGFHHLGIKPVVYCAGYDWRQDNARSALRVAAVVEEALRETRAQKCIIIAHGMGGLVARYYCHALGGEARVHELYLIGSPTLGMPGAFIQLKQGVFGAYLKDYILAPTQAKSEEDVIDIVRPYMSLGPQVVHGAVNRSFFEALGPFYVALCLGAGRLLTPAETGYFARQMTSFYQLMPNRVFCDRHRHWLIFDPIATGHPPTGYLVVFPGLLEQTVMTAGDIAAAIEGNASKAGEDARKAYETALGLGRYERTSPRAHRNMTTLEDLIEDFVDAHVYAESDPRRLEDAGMAVKAIFERLEQAFIDCRSPKHLYADIYTGLMDNVQQRPLVAGNLALAERFDRALSTGKGQHKEAPLSIFKSILNPILKAAGVPLPTSAEAEETTEGPPLRGELRAYMHPRTTNVYASHARVDLGCMIVPTDIFSNDDSNVVKYEILPFPVFAPGDGSVPADSANPRPGSLSSAFEDSYLVTELHGDMPGALATTNYVGGRIQLGLDLWIKGEL